MNSITPTTKSSRSNRKPAPRVEQLAGLEPSHADVAIAIAEERPVPMIDPAVAERIAKEKAKLEREEKAIAARRARVEALEQGKPIPQIGKGLPPVVKMNELGAVARQLHRALKLAESDEVKALAATAEVGECDVRAIVYLRGARNEAIALWTRQYEARVAAGAADNDTLHALGLEADATGDFRLIEKGKKSE